MTNTEPIAELLSMIAQLCDAIDDDPEPPAATRDRIRLALDMMLDDAHDCDDDDSPYPYDESTLIDIADRLHSKLTLD